jgi:hypothetical protein
VFAGAPITGRGGRESSTRVTHPQDSVAAVRPRLGGRLRRTAGGRATEATEAIATATAFLQLNGSY